MVFYYSENQKTHQVTLISWTCWESNPSLIELSHAH
nr:MAG TPA: hypothetical protein [Caudoviricetes sp.]